MFTSSKKRYLIEINILLLLAFTVRYFQLFSVDYANGWDGAFYEMQLTHWKESGVLHSENNSLIYGLLKVLSVYLSPLYSYKILAVVTAALFPWIAYLFIYKKTSDVVFSLGGFLIIMGSPIALFVSHQFTKSLMGMCCILLYFLVSPKWYFKLLIVLFSILLHRFAFVFLVGLFLLEFILTFFEKKKVDSKVWIGIGIVLLVGALSMQFSGLITWQDYERIIPEVNIGAYWMPIQFLDTFSPETNKWYWWIDVFIFHTLIIIGALKAYRKKLYISLVVLILLSVLPMFGYKSGSLGYRLWLNAFLLAFLFFPLLFDFKKIKWSVFIIGICLLPFGLTSYIPDRFDPPIQQYKTITEIAKDKILLLEKSPDVIIAHKGLKEQLILATNFEASNWVPDTTTIHTLRIVSNLTDADIINYQFDRQDKWIKLYPGYYLTFEDNWIQYKKTISERNELELLERINTWQNPSQYKPSFLR